jgi:hypothetical protein
MPFDTRIWGMYNQSMTDRERQRLRSRIVERELREWYVTPGWVARYFKVRVIDVHRAIDRGQLQAIRIQGRWGGAGYHGWVLDMRKLPVSWEDLNGARP